MRHRPIGMGVQGLADTFCKMKIPFESEEVSLTNSPLVISMKHNDSSTQIWNIDLNAFHGMEIGIENWNVLFEIQASCFCNQIHC